jgi:hypothetical protein
MGLMPATRNIQASTLFSLPFIGYQPANISNGEPAVSCANLVKQTILGAPFIWPWNRGTMSEVSVEDEQDYIVPATQFGFVEQVWIIDSKGKAKEIEVKTSLSVESAIARPASCAVQFQDDDGITLRLNTIPDQSYTLGGFYQKAPQLMSSMASSWSPIPDSLSYIYDWGYLGLLSMITKDIRQPLFLQKFVSHLLGAQSGLTALQRNIFIGDWLTLMTQVTNAQGNAGQGVQARSAT